MFDYRTEYERRRSGALGQESVKKSKRGGNGSDAPALPKWARLVPRDVREKTTTKVG